MKRTRATNRNGRCKSANRLRWLVLAAVAGCLEFDVQMPSAGTRSEDSAPNATERRPLEPEGESTRKSPRPSRPRDDMTRMRVTPEDKDPSTDGPEVAFIPPEAGMTDVGLSDANPPEVGGADVEVAEAGAADDPPSGIPDGHSEEVGGFPPGAPCPPGSVVFVGGARYICGGAGHAYAPALVWVLSI